MVIVPTRSDARRFQIQKKGSKFSDDIKNRLPFDLGPTLTKKLQGV